MKVQSPAHHMIQLRRKTQKLATPKVYWDLSNKQNNHTMNSFQKKKDASSKKSSLQKKTSMKKILSVTQHTPKCTTIKRIGFQMHEHKRPKQKSVQKNIKKKDSKSYSTQPSPNQFANKMDRILKKASRKQKFVIQAEYNQCFNCLQSKNEIEPCNFHIVKQHLEYWVARCEALELVLNTVSQTPSLAERQIQTAHIYSQEISENQNSEYSYIVDPSEKIKPSKPLRKQLKEQLHLNFERVNNLRKFDFQ